MAWGSHYEVLGVARSADWDIIRAAYRVLAKRYHPDTTTGPKDIAAARFCKFRRLTTYCRMRAGEPNTMPSSTPQLESGKPHKRHHVQLRNPNHNLITGRPNENLHRKAKPA